LAVVAKYHLKILGYRSIGVTSLTFQGHVTSSITWPVDSHRSFPIDGSPRLYL